ncbi:MAG: hypothetical protein KJ578_09220 [Bacteroidetes bacterium]|nr:hypothetical protein [Bacteroidota bacterium]MBU1580513.1 hypothetical protein [Bacteroidota bacterium]MBU2466990.1 hypothetical protein [Bacteroidota bacterium]MBU2557942.1 hypothetical protein [Bacteroidota bacterium]
MVNTLNESYYDELMLSHRQPARISHADGYVSLDENGEASFYYTLKDHTSASLRAGLLLILKPREGITFGEKVRAARVSVGSSTITINPIGSTGSSVAISSTILIK